MKPITPQMLAELKRRNISPEQVTLDGVALSAIPTTKERRYGKYRSKWEAMYADELNTQLRASLIDGWLYEPISLYLTEPTVVNGKTIAAVRYTPDFLVWIGDEIVCVEVKGFKREASIARYKMAKDKFRMFKFVMVTREDNRWKQIM